jgi:hypothetical protein
MANIYQARRTSVSGRDANTTTLTNPGEIAINITDGKAFSCNSTAVFQLGANVDNQRATQTLTIGNTGDTSNLVVNTTVALYRTNSTTNSQISASTLSIANTAGYITVVNTAGIILNSNSQVTIGSPSIPAANGYLAASRTFALDGAIFAMYSDVTISNTTYTSSRSAHNYYSQITNDSQYANSTGGLEFSSTLYGGYMVQYNGSTVGANSRLTSAFGLRSEFYQRAGGSAANTTGTYTGLSSLVSQMSSGVMTTVHGSRMQISAVNNSVTGNITTVYGHRVEVTANTAMTIGTSYIIRGDYAGANFTTKFGVYIDGESNNYFSGNVYIAGRLSPVIIVANGALGTATQVLSANSTGGVYWADAGAGGGLSQQQVMKLVSMRA